MTPRMTRLARCRTACCRISSCLLSTYPAFSSVHRVIPTLLSPLYTDSLAVRSRARTVTRARCFLLLPDGVAWVGRMAGVVVVDGGDNQAWATNKKTIIIISGW